MAGGITDLFLQHGGVPDLAISARIKDLLQAPALLFCFLIDPEAGQEFGRVQHSLQSFISVHLDAFQFISVQRISYWYSIMIREVDTLS